MAVFATHCYKLITVERSYIKHSCSTFYAPPRRA